MDVAPWPAALEPTQSFLRAAEVDGVRIGYYDRGSGNTLLLLHGMFGDYLDWEPVLEPLSRKHRVIAPDLPGFGSSAKPKVEYTGDFFVSQIEGFLSRLGLARVTLVGNSFGGILALLFALRHPERIERLILITSGGLHFWTEKERKDALARFSTENLNKLSPAVHEKLFLPLFVHAPPHIGARYLAKQNAKLARPDFAEYTHVLHSSVLLALDANLQEQVREIKVPTLLIHGDMDRVIPLAAMETAVQRFPLAQLQVIPGCGHVPQLEQPGAVIAAIESFIAAI